jgi:hypothetical protein
MRMRRRRRGAGLTASMMGDNQQRRDNKTSHGDLGLLEDGASLPRHPDAVILRLTAPEVYTPHRPSGSHAQSALIRLLARDLRHQRRKSPQRERTRRNGGGALRRDLLVDRLGLWLRQFGCSVGTRDSS